MSNYKGYKLEDNLKRKANNTGDQLGWGQNNNVKSYSSKPGQLSMKSQARHEANHLKVLNKKQPVKCLSSMICPIERFYFLNKVKKAA